jgi:thiol-disulfide isomerase/thioredoxin
MTVQAVTDKDLQDELKNNTRIAIKYYADWCGSCRLIAPKFKKLSEDDRFTDIKFIEINAEQNPEARKFAGVTNLPFFAMVKDGKIVAGDSVAKEEKVVEMLEKIAL